jgi:hypothetical protein
MQLSMAQPFKARDGRIAKHPQLLQVSWQGRLQGTDAISVRSGVAQGEPCKRSEVGEVCHTSLFRLKVWLVI